LDPGHPVLLVIGGSQGASGLNELVMEALPGWAEELPELQFLHLTGSRDLEKVRAAYARAGRRAWVEAFTAEMHLAMSAAVAAVSRAGASTLAELAAARLPAVLVPFPHAADNHQWHNAREMLEAGAARMVEQSPAASRQLVSIVVGLVRDREVSERMRDSLRSWDRPSAAADIAAAILERQTDATKG
jgi:UDP-N-acetylglucosamine--N-acetylmuramyl-(pentapeptide) pyrophosphoryl-undecaprenol N-acetylglucosamine transferase